MRMIRHFAAAALTMLALAAHADREPIRIALTGPFTGPSSPMGLSMRAGVRVAAEEINLGGGLFGHPLEIVERDDKGDPETAKKVVQDVVQSEKVVAALGLVNTGVALAATPFYQEAKIPVMVNVATGTKVTQQFAGPGAKENYVFRNSANDTIQSTVIAREAVERRKFTKIAIFHDTSPYGELGRGQLIDELARRNIKPVAVEGFAVGTTDLSAALKRAKEAGAEVILTYALAPELAVIANGRAKMNWMVPMIGSWTLSLPNFIEAAGRNAEGVRMPQSFIEEANNSRRTGFITSYHKANRSNRIPSAVSAAQGYDSLYLLIYAMFQAGSTEGPKVRAALENLQKPYYGVITTYDRPFTAQDHEAISENMVIMGEIKNGRIVYAYAEDEKRGLTVQTKRR